MQPWEPPLGCSTPNKLKQEQEVRTAGGEEQHNKEEKGEQDVKGTLDLETTVSLEEDVVMLEEEEKQEQEVKGTLDLEATVSVEEEADWNLSTLLDCDITIVCQVMYNYIILLFTIIFRMARRCCLGCY